MSTLHVLTIDGDVVGVDIDDGFPTSFDAHFQRELRQRSYDRDAMGEAIGRAVGGAVLWAHFDAFIAHDYEALMAIDEALAP